MTTIVAADVDQAFMNKPRLGILMTTRDDGSPLGVPVWFEWDGEAVQLFSAIDSLKVHQARGGRKFALLVTNDVGEPERWFSFEGQPAVAGDGAYELAARLAERYWDMSEPGRQKMVQTWRDNAEHLCRVVLAPTRIRTGS